MKKNSIHKIMALTFTNLHLFIACLQSFAHVISLSNYSPLGELNPRTIFCNSAILNLSALIHATAFNKKPFRPRILIGTFIKNIKIALKWPINISEPFLRNNSCIAQQYPGGIFLLIDSKSYSKLAAKRN